MLSAIFLKEKMLVQILHEFQGNVSIMLLSLMASDSSLPELEHFMMPKKWKIRWWHKTFVRYCFLIAVLNIFLKQIYFVLNLDCGYTA